MSGFLRNEIKRSGKACVTVLPAGQTFEMASGSPLIEAVMRVTDLVTKYCGGRARCGVCHVMVRQGARGLSKIRKSESDRLARLGGAITHSRLSCQALVGHRRVTIELVNH